MISTRGNGWLTTLAAVALVLVVAGCTTTQSPKRQVDDNAIHAAVMAKLTGAHVSNILNVDVNVTNGVAYDPVFLLSASDLTLPLSNWTCIATNQFSASGTAGFTNAIIAGETTRYFRVAVE